MRTCAFLSIVAFRLVTPAFNRNELALHWIRLIALIALIDLIVNWL